MNKNGDRKNLIISIQKERRGWIPFYNSNVSLLKSLILLVSIQPFTIKAKRKL